MTSTLAIIVVFGLIVLVHELGHFITAKLTGMYVEEFAIGFGPKIVSFKYGETRYSIRAIPLGGFNKISGMDLEDTSAGDRAYCKKPLLSRLLVISAGSLMNFILPIFLIAFSAYYYGITTPSNAPVIGQVMVSSPAYDAGLKAGDKIVSIDGFSINNWQEIGEKLQDKEGRSVHLIINRDNEDRKIQVFPRQDADSKKLLIGIMPSGTTEHFSLGQSLEIGFSYVVNVIQEMYKGLLDLITGKSSAELSGPIGVAQMTSQYAKMGMQALITFTAILSINLGVINLLPIPALDGGHIVMLIIEGIYGKPISPKVLKKVQAIGVVLLLSLMVFATTKDIFKIFN